VAGKISMESTERVVLSFKDKVFTVICTLGVMSVMAGIFSLGLIPYVEVTVWPTSLRLVLVGVVLVWLAVKFG